LLLHDLHSPHPCGLKNLSFTHRLSGYFFEVLWNQELVLETVSNCFFLGLLYKIIYKELGRIAIRRFPYRIFYLIQDNQIVTIQHI
jgi:hypothetical protein